MMAIHPAKFWQRTTNGLERGMAMIRFRSLVADTSGAGKEQKLFIER